MNYFNDDQLANNVWEGKYKQGDELPQDMHRRMAKEFYRIDKQYQKLEGDLKHKLSHIGKNRKNLTEESIFNYFDRFKYIIPQGSVMSTLGTDIPASLSNCFVAESPYDSYSGINKTDGDLIGYFVRRCGVGIDISNLRPNRTKTNNVAKYSTGATSFMDRYSNTTKEVAQGGRRGALMLSIHVNHPDVWDFATKKSDRTSVTGANISIKLTDEFMEAVRNNTTYKLRFPVDGDLNDPNTIVKEINAKEYWDLFMKQARNHAEPGIMYWDSVLNYDPAAVYDDYVPISSNPCGEQFLNAHDSCRLIAINLLSFVENPYTNKAYFDYNKFEEVVYEAMRLGDNLIDLEVEYIDRILDKIKSDPEPEYIKEREYQLWNKSKETALSGRRIGLGITALGDTLAALGFKYDSEEGLKAIEDIFSQKLRAELHATTDLSILRSSFKGWDKNKEFTDGELKGTNKFYQHLVDEFYPEVVKMLQHGRRNVSWSTCAPTGSVSILAQTTSGVEPLFMPYYIRRKKVNPSEDGMRVDFVDSEGVEWEEYAVIHYPFREWIKNHLAKENEYFKDIDVLNMSISDADKAYKLSPWYQSIAEDIDWLKRVEVQSIIQKHTTNAISSTVNLPSSVTIEEVSDIYMKGWELGLKGITTYTEGSRDGVMVKESIGLKLGDRPDELECKVLRFRNEKKQWIAFVGLVDDNPYEIFTGINDLDAFPVPSYVEEGYIIKVSTEEGSRYDFKYTDSYGYVNVIGGLNRIFSKEYWNYARFTSALMREGVPVHNIVKIIEKLEFTNKSLNSWQAGVVRSLSGFIKDGTRSKGAVCEECASEDIEYREGCLTCLNCGSSKCG